MELRKEFKNELGNAISIATENKDIDGVAGVYFSITGPSSEMTGHITREEARVLLDQLSEILT